MNVNLSFSLSKNELKLLYDKFLELNFSNEKLSKTILYLKNNINKNENNIDINFENLEDLIYYINVCDRKDILIDNKCLNQEITSLFYKLNTAKSLINEYQKLKNWEL